MCASKAIIIVLILGFGKVWTSPTHDIQQITNRAGIYYEPMHEVHFTRTEWRLTTFIDLRPFENHQPTFSEVPVMEHACRPYLEDHCKSLIDKEDLILKSTLINKYLLYIRKQKGIEPTISRRSVPFGFIGTISKSLFGTLTTDDAEYFNTEIDKLYQDQKKMAILARNQTHIVRSELHDIAERLSELEKEHNRKWKNLADTFYNATNIIMYTYKLKEWRNSIGNIAETYLESLRAIVNAIHFIKLGLLHPELLNPVTLDLIVKSFTETHHRYLFPIPLDEIHSGTLSKISRLSASYHDKKIIIVINIPLLEPTKFLLYKLHPCPISQQIGNNSQGAAYVQPRASHIIISQEADKYALIPENDPPRCQHLRNYQICAPTYPIYEVSAHQNCELLLLTDGGHQSYEDCEIRVIKKQTPYWKQLDTMSGWLFSLPEPERIQILCDHEAAIVLEIKETGILKLKPGCIAKTHYVTISGSQTLEGTIQETYIPASNLSINQLVPNVSDYKPLQDTDTSSYTPSVITRNSAGVPIFDTTLREIEQELLETASHKRERQEQTQYTMMTIYGEILLAMGFLTYILRGSVLHGIYKICTICRKPAPPPEDCDDDLLEQEEPPQPAKRRVDSTYDTPPRQPNPVFIHEASTQTTV